MIGRWHAQVLVVAVLVFSASGCSPGQVEVSGRVTYNGSPLNFPGGQIVFVGPDGAQRAASIAADGTYRAVEVSAGMNRVAVSYPNPEFKPQKRIPRGTDPESLPEPFLIPAKYASVEDSELSVQATTGTVFSPDLIGPEIR
jgi:hypothetical protein